MAGTSQYFEVLYPFQDAVLQTIASVETGFYLTGGTAASRGYLAHRFSDDLDLFVNDAPRFGLWSERVVQALVASHGWRVEVTLKEPRFVRLVVVLASKITALADREEPKDLADVWGFCCRLDLSIAQALGDHGKAAGLFPVDVARVLLSADRSDWALVRWIEAPDPERFIADLGRLGEELLLLR